MKLGEILIASGVLTESQLEKALKAQLIFGGHLGTSLIELGFIDEETLGTVLSKTSGVPYAAPDLFESIPEATLNAVPAKVAEEYQVVPLKLVEQAVHVALINPRDLRVLDELSFAIGRRVVPWIAPEVRIFQALERYYAVGRLPRYITLGTHLDRAERRKHAGTGTSPEDADGKAWQKAAEALEKPKRPAPGVEEPKDACSLMPLSELAERYCRADSRDDLALAALAFGVGRANRMLFLHVRGDRASVWQERGLNLAVEARGLVSFQVTSEALFGLLMGDNHFHGDLPPREEIRSFYRRLGADEPLDLLLIPLRVNGLLVAFAIADGGPRGRIQGQVEEFLKAFHLFGMSLGLVALRKKIREAAQPVTRVVV